MMITTYEVRTEDLARRLFDLTTQVSLATAPGKRRPGDLKELEHLTLAALSERGTMIVGDIQRILGVLPAQMSRLIRSLENRERPLITCRINVRDKRKIDVTITPLGQKALADHQTNRVHRLATLLRDLREDDREDLQRSLDRVAGAVDSRPRL